MGTKNSAVAIITDGAKLGVFIAGIKRAGAKLDKDIHIAAVSAAAHFKDHGDVFQINNLYDAMPKGARHVALTAWLLAFAGVSANEGESKAKTPFIKDGNKQVDLPGGMDSPWFTMKPSKKPDAVVDLLKIVLAGIKKASAETAEVVHGEMLDDLRALAEKYGDADESAGDDSPVEEGAPVEGEPALTE